MEASEVPLLLLCKFLDPYCLHRGVGFLLEEEDVLSVANLVLFPALVPTALSMTSVCFTKECSASLRFRREDSSHIGAVPYGLSISVSAN